MKINFITCSTHLTGGNRVVMELINHLAEKGHEVTLVTLGSKKDLGWIRLKGKSIHVERSLIEKITGYLFRKAFGAQLFPEEETRMIVQAVPIADINVATISYTGFAVHRIPFGVPFQYYMHYEPFVREDGYKKKVIEEAYFLPIHLLTNSSWLAETIEAETGKKTIGNVYPAIDHSIFHASSPKKHLDKNTEIKIVSLAKDKWWKGFPDALRAVQIVRDAGYRINFSAFGGSFDRKNLPEDVKNIPFEFAGRKVDSELAEFYHDSDILISASYFESFPLPPIEAMSCGVPVVTTQYGTEDYAIDRVNSSVVLPKDPRALAEKIIELIEDKKLYEQYSRNGIEKAKEFTWQNAANQIEKYFLEALSTK